MKKFTVGAAVVILILAAVILISLNRQPRSRLGSSVANLTEVSRAQAEYVVRLADCVACHSVPNGEPFAGGLKMGSPLGAIYATNITPDTETGIGNYSLADFDNAVRHGVARDGRRLYPAMPYPSYAKLSDADVEALYAYIMQQVKPVHEPNRVSDITWPLSIRWPLAIWNILFADDRVFEDDPSQSKEWNRGAYLVQGLGHCGACHTPRGIAFQEKALDDRGRDFLSGASLDGWVASSLRGEAVAGLGQWSQEDVVSILKSGGNSHSTLFGSMQDAFNNSTQFFTDDDLSAIALYLKSLPPRKSPTPVSRDSQVASAGGSMREASGDPGAETYAQHCASCHGPDGAGQGHSLPALAGNPALLDDDPASVINITLNGTGRLVVQGAPDFYRMPAFRATLSDRQIADVSTFVRNSWGNRAARVEAGKVASLRRLTDTADEHVIILKMH